VIQDVLTDFLWNLEPKASARRQGRHRYCERCLMSDASLSWSV
jgi:hypothetical protein